MRARGYGAAILAAALAGIAAAAQNAPPPPRLATPLRLLGNPASWVTQYDYPSMARRAGEHGTTVFRLDIDADGKVTHCTVVVSSGSAILDRTTCRLLLKRAHFAPAQDGYGRNIPATYTNRFNWML